MKKLLLLSAFLSLLFVLYFQTRGEVPEMINYQGRLTTADKGCINDTVQMTFSVYPDSFGTDASWTETQDNVVVKEGLFSVLLGSVVSMPTSLFDGNVKYLGVQVESDAEMRPLKPMLSVPYAYRAGTVDGSGTNCGWVDVGTVVRLETGTDCVAIGETPPDDAKLYVKTDTSVWMFAIYAEGQKGMKGVSTALAGTGMSGEGGHAGVAGYGGYIGVLGQGFYGGYFQGNGYFSGNLGIGTTSPARKLHINDVMRLEPVSDFPSSPNDGDLCVKGVPGDYHVYCYLNGDWRQLD